MIDVILSIEAEVDLLEITSFISSGDEAIARRFVYGLMESLDLLSEYPEMGRKRDDLKRGLRSINFNRYLVLYKIEGTRVEVVRIVHGARDIASLFEEPPL
jgi:toxin ParE1/3/4